MRNLASSEGSWGESSSQDDERAAQARQVYARKRADEAARERCLALGRLVQTEIIPQLVLLHRRFVAEQIKPAFKPDVEQVAAFTDLALAPETVVYPGHGIETTIGQERLTNPFLNGTARIVGR